MTTIAENTGFVTLINVFTVEPSNQQALVDILARATDASVRDMPGFISAALHRSVDGTKVTMYGQWKSVEHYQHYQHYQSMRAGPATSPYVAEVLAIATFEPGMYEVAKVFDGPSEPAR